MVNAWLPEKPAQILIHVCSVCSSTFQKFIGGQATEAVILGTLCMIGMFLGVPVASAAYIRIIQKNNWIGCMNA